MSTISTLFRDQDRQLDKKDLNELLQVLLPTSVKWYPLGLSLGLDADTLNTIEKDNNNKSEDCLRKMLYCCLCCKPFTLPILCNSLRAGTVLREDIAKEIEKGIQSERLRSGIGASTSAHQPVNELETAPSFCGQKRKQSDQYEKKLTPQQPNDDLRSIRIQYQALLSSTKESLVEREIIPGELIAFLKDLQLLSTEQEGGTLLDTIKHLIQYENLQKACSIPEIFNELAPALTFLDYDILEDIIKTFGKKAEKDNLTKYKDALKEFLEFWEAPPGHKLKVPRTESISENDQGQICFKFKSIKMSIYSKLKKEIAKIFAVAECAIILISIEEGCVELVFLFPKTVIEKSLSLTPSQKAQLDVVTPSILRVTVVGETSAHKQVIFKVEKETEAVTITEKLTSQTKRTTDLRLPKLGGQASRLVRKGSASSPFSSLTADSFTRSKDRRGFEPSAAVYDQVRKRSRTNDSDESQQIREDMREIETKFANLLTEIRQSFTKKLDPQEVAQYLLGFRSSLSWRPVLASENFHFASRHSQLEEATSIDKIFSILSPFWSFLDYDLLQTIVCKYGDDTDKQTLENYIENLKTFLLELEVRPCKIHRCEIPSNQTKLHIRLDTDSIHNYRNIKSCVARIFGLKIEAVQLMEIGNGSIKLTFLVPRIVLHSSTHVQHTELIEMTPTVLSVVIEDPKVTPPYKEVIYDREVANKGSSSESDSDREKVKSQDQKSEAGKDSEAAAFGTLIEFWNQASRMVGGLISQISTKHVSVKLLEACRSENPNIDLIKSYLKQEDCDVNIQEDDENMRTPLMWACEKKYTEISKLLLEYHPRVNMQSKKGWSALHLASKAGDLEIVKILVALGADIDMPTNKNWTPLMWAAQEGHADVAQFLLEKGAFVDNKDVNEWTPLMQASQEGRVDAVNILLDYNANVNYMTDSIFWCALMAAAKNRHSEVVDTLLKRGAYVDIARDDGCTALYVAVHYENNTDVVETLLKHKANIDFPNKRGRTALMLAAEQGRLDMVQTLINGGADINKRCPSNGYTAIFFAAENGHMSIFKELLDHGAETEIEGLKAVNVASINDREEILSLLGEPHQLGQGSTLFSSLLEGVKSLF